MRKLVLILMGLIALSTFISAYNETHPENPGESLKSSKQNDTVR